MNKEEKILECEKSIKLNVKQIANKQLTKFLDIEDDAKNNRLKAFQLMKKTEKKNLNKIKYENLNETNQPFHQKINVFDDDKNEIKVNRNYDDKSKNLFVLNKFEEYYNDKLCPKNECNEDESDGNILITENNKEKNKKFDLELKYTLGINTKSFGSMCFHKEAKWVAFLNKNLVIIEKFEKESNRDQKILNDSKSYLSTVKISENGSILMAYSKRYDNFTMSFPEIFFWDTKKDLSLINKTVFKHTEIHDSEISMQNNFCAVLSSNIDSESFVSILDFYNNEVLVTTTMTIKMLSLKWNKFLRNLEFATLSTQKFTFWTLNSNVTLKYQFGEFSEKLLENPQKSFTCLEYSPPLSCNCNILLLIGLTNGELWGIDTKTNSIAIKFDNKTDSINNEISNILCTIRYITLISSNKVEYYVFPSLRLIRKMRHDDFNILVNKKDCLDLDSDIISYDFDILKSCGLALTKNGVLWYLNYEEKASIRLHVNIDEDSEITLIKVISKDFQSNALRKIDYDEQIIENARPELNKSEYFLITGHKSGKLKLWSIPEYSILSVFDSVSEELVTFETSYNELKLVASYKTGTIRFFDLAKSKCLGKYKTLSNEYFKFMKFLPDGKWLFLIDNYGTILLLKIEKWEPIAIQLHQLFNLSGDIFHFNIHPQEQYNKFLINLSNIFLCVYNRKFTNLLKNLDYDTSLPQFALQDKFNIEEYLKLEMKLDKGNLIENFVMEFAPKEKGLVYILSQARNIMILRNYEHHMNLKSICFEKVQPIDYCFAPDSSFVLYILKHRRLQMSQIGSNTGNISNCLIQSEENLNFSISSNSKLVVISSENTLATFIIN